MGIRKFNPTTPSRRQMTASDFADVTSNESKPERSLVRKRHRKGGRNNHGRISVRFKSGGHKRRYRVVDFRRDKLDVPVYPISAVTGEGVDELLRALVKEVDALNDPE